MDNYFSRYIHSALTGDETAYETLYNLTKDALFFAALNITKNDQDAINILKESYTHAFENLSSLDKPEIFEIWLNRIAAYSAYSFVIEKNPTAFGNITENFKWSDEDNYDQLPQETIDDKDTRNIVKDIIDKLPDDQRLLVIMHYYQEMDISAISNTLDLPENTVMCILSYARERIKQEISKAEAESKLMRSVSLGAVSYTLTELAKSQFLFHPAPSMSSIIAAPNTAAPIVEEKNDIQAILNIPSPSETQPQEQIVQESQEEYVNPYQQQQEQTVQETQEEYINPYQQQQEQTVQESQEEYINPYQQQQEQAVQESQEEYVNPYQQQQEQTVQESQEEYVNPYQQQQEQTIQESQEEYINPYQQQQEQTVQEPQEEYVNPYQQQQEQTVQESQDEYVNSYLQRQKQAIQEESHQPQEQTEQETPQEKKSTPAKSGPYKRVLESNFSVDSNPKSKSKKVKKSKQTDSSLSKITNFFKSTAGIATVAGIVVIAIGAVLFYYISNAAKNSSLSTDGMIESSYNTPTESEDSHEPTAEELRAAELKADEKNYLYKEYSNGTLHIIGYNGGLEDIVIPETYENKMVTGIDPMAFQGCSQIKSITISKNIQSISLDNKETFRNPFYDCIYMKNIYVDEINRYFTSVDGVLYNKDKTTLLFYPSYKTDKTYAVLDSVNKIQVGAFQRNGIITEITLPKGLAAIGEEAFCECTSLRKIEIPSGITEIKKSLFSGCKALEEISLPNTIKEIKNNAFYNCNSLREITIPSSVDKLGSAAFEKCTVLNTCTIENSNMTFQNSSDEESIFTNTQVTLRAKKGSTAEKYAEKWKLYFSYM